MLPELTVDNIDVIQITNTDGLMLEHQVGEALEQKNIHYNFYINST